MTAAKRRRMRWNVLAVLGGATAACGALMMMTEVAPLTLFTVFVLVGACIDAFCFAPPWKPPVDEAPAPERDVRLLPRAGQGPRWIERQVLPPPAAPVWITDPARPLPLDAELFAACEDQVGTARARYEVEAARQDLLGTVLLLPDGTLAV